MMAWSNFRETIDFTSISTITGLKNRRSSNHQLVLEKTVFRLSVLLVSHENRNPELSGEEVDGQGLASLAKASLPTRESKHLSRIPEESEAGSKPWHCFRAIRSSDQVQYLISSKDFSVCSNKLPAPETEVFISMNSAAQRRRVILEGVISVLPKL